MPGRSSTASDPPEAPAPGRTGEAPGRLQANAEGETVRKPAADSPSVPAPEPERERPAKEAPAALLPSEAIGSPPTDSDAPQIPIPIARLIPKLRKSQKLFEEGKRRIPNATSSLIRVASYDPCPPFIARGKGSKIWDEDGNEYLDFNLGYGCLINGHAHPEMVKAVQAQAELGFHFASPTALEIEVAKMFQKLVPSAERVAFC
ncbi:MAG: aminotransferase class III-fold pyridoxal phosphate-dependent enzyme, partial [Thermoplasmata archaeon]|nr:aminotransferase class III-fold pyridoxal phosphate-dependent enzyme [Thermoplasmata archaeon]